MQYAGQKTQIARSRPMQLPAKKKRGFQQHEKLNVYGRTVVQTKTMQTFLGYSVHFRNNCAPKIVLIQSAYPPVFFIIPINILTKFRLHSFRGCGPVKQNQYTNKKEGCASRLYSQVTRLQYKGFRRRLRLRTLKTLKTQNSRNGVISSKRHKNTPEVSHFYSLY